MPDKSVAVSSLLALISDYAQPICHTESFYTLYMHLSDCGCHVHVYAHVKWAGSFICRVKVYMFFNQVDCFALPTYNVYMYMYLDLFPAYCGGLVVRAPARFKSTLVQFSFSWKLAECLECFPLLYFAVNHYMYIVYIQCTCV